MSSPKRNRARILTASGIKKLREQIRSHEAEENAGYKYTLERLGELTGLDPETVKNVLDCKGSDKRTISRCFESFGLTLADSDHIGATQAAAAPSDPNFVGRDEAIADLNALVNRNARVIVIQARGGVGKTTLARKYLQQEFSSFLEFPIAKETKDIASIEGLIEEKLRQLGEESGREFLVSLDRLKRKLQGDRIGILIDNLEPALDSAGKFIDAHRRYVELLRVLSDPIVKSITLITSRERLREADITVQHYPLRSLDVQAWEQFFQSRSIQLTHLAPHERGVGGEGTLAALHNAYGGNAKAMDIISGAVLEDFSGDVEAYWQANQDDLFIERDLEDLVTKQFDRLQQLDSDAYNLLCRMGCYRYQDVPTVPIEGLFCLLWDVPENRHRRVIKSLQDRSLIDFENDEFWLHPVIRVEAMVRLQGNEEWKIANRKAADLWRNSVKNTRDIREVRGAFEAYYHYVEISDFESANEVIIKKISGVREPSLGDLLFHMGSSMEVISAITRIEQELHPSHSLVRTYDLLGHLYAMRGDLKKALTYHGKTKEMAIEHSSEPYVLFSEFNIGFRNIELWEIGQAIASFETAYTLSEKLSLDHKKFFKYQILARCYLLFLMSIQGKENCTKELVLNTYIEFSKFDSFLTDWNFGCGLIYLGLAFRLAKEICFAYECNKKALNIATRNCYPRLEAWALFRLGSLCSKYPNIHSSDSIDVVLYHEKALEILSKMNAKGDLAEAYFQFGLTYQMSGQLEKSQTNFQEAIQLFSEIEAPKQVERVRQSMQNYISNKSVEPNSGVNDETD